MATAFENLFPAFGLMSAIALSTLLSIGPLTVALLL